MFPEVVVVGVYLSAIMDHLVHHTHTDTHAHTHAHTVSEPLHHSQFPGPPSGISHYHLQRGDPFKYKYALWQVCYVCQLNDIFRYSAYKLRGMMLACPNLANVIYGSIFFLRDCLISFYDIVHNIFAF